MNHNRRTLLKGTMAASATGLAISAGLLTPKSTLAAWSKAAFEAKNVDDALTAQLGSSSMSTSKKIKLKAPDIAENGAVVPITVTSNISGTETISLLVPKNAQPMTATFTLGANAKGYVSTRIKMGKTSDVIAVVKAGGKLYSAKKQVKVTIGGCGG
jgi:sulfur-oxidizing protein SoxY